MSVPDITWQENYEAHWNYVDFQGKTILDLGADYGSTATWFVRKGARKIIAVEGDPKSFSQLERNYAGDDRVIVIQLWIDSSKQIEALLEEHQPDLVKVDIEGAERTLLDVPFETLRRVPLYLVETHSQELEAQILDLFARLGYDGKTCITLARDIKVHRFAASNEAGENAD